MLLEQNYTKENWDISQNPKSDFGQIVTHKSFNMKVEIKFYPDTNDLLFEIWQGDRMLGANRCWAPNIEVWKDDFIYHGGFNVFLSSQNIKMF